MMSTIFIQVFLLWLIIGRAVSVCLKGTKSNGVYYLTCKIDWLRADVEIYRPDKVLYGSCPGPTTKSPTFVTCDDLKTITQDLITNTTTVSLRENATFSIFGEWMCKHGTSLGNDTWKIEPIQDPGMFHSCIISSSITALSTFVMTICFGIGIWKVIPAIIPFVQERRRKRQKDTELDPILGKLTERVETHSEETTPLLEIAITTENATRCKSCTSMTVCAICSDCETMFCEICCNTHILIETEHNVFQLEHDVTSSFDAKCKMCLQHADCVCMICIKELCPTCSQTHSNQGHTIKLLVHKRGTSDNRRKREKIDSENACHYKYTITYAISDPNFKTPRICGVCFLAEGRIVVAECNCRELKIFSENTVLFKHSLRQEPKGMAKLNDCSIAITFPYEREIRLYNINNKSVEDVKTITILVGKPFSIAYNHGHFAVEIGEGDDGVIVIINENGEVLHTIRNNNAFAYFTSNTIRLALDVDKRKIFVAALSKKAVSCIDYGGNILWSKAIPSPRGIVFIHEENNLIIASKKWNLLYKMNSDDGIYEIITAGGHLHGPRYIDYYLTYKLLCVQVDKGQIVVYKYDITKR